MSSVALETEMSTAIPFLVRPPNRQEEPGSLRKPLGIARHGTKQ